MQSNSTNTFIDYFKLFKVFELKKIEKTGLVKIVQDKLLNRKIISVEGNISTSNFIVFQAQNFPNMPFSQRYLYVQGFVDAGKSFCMQVTYTLGNKLFKAVYSTLYKNAKIHLQNIVHLPISFPQCKWTIGVIDLYELGIHFGFKPQEMKMIFRVNAIEIRASSKVKGIFQSDYLYSIDKMPKDICFNLKRQQNYFEKYHYFVETSDPASLKYVTQFKQVIQKQIQSKKFEKHKQASIEKLKQSKSVEGQKSNNSKNTQSLQKKLKIQEKSQKISLNATKKNSKGSLPPKNNLNRKKEDKLQKNISNQIQFQQNDIEQHQMMPPKPQPMMSLQLSCIEGFSLNSGNLMSVESYICRPNYMPTHKPVQLLSSCDEVNMRIITAYNDGSVCLWDAIRKNPLSYFMTELHELKLILNDSFMNIVLVGFDKLKRQVINIISQNSIIFRQISNFNITGALLISKQSFQFGIVTFGYQNIRLWKINKEKSIIQGSSIYLGQTNRKMKYTSGLVITTREDFLIYVTDNNGFITTISVAESKMLQSVKLDSCCIDHIMLLRDGRAIICNQLGIIKIIDLSRMQVQEEYSLNNRIKDIKQLQTQQIIMTHYNKSIGQLNLQSSMYSFLMRCHTSTISKICYSSCLNKAISISKDNSIRIWQYVIQNEGPFGFRLQQQYEFIITGQEMVDIACGTEGRIEDLANIIIGGDSGRLRLVNIQKYSIFQQIVIEANSMNLSMSKNGKYILCTYSSGNTYLLDSNLNILFRYLRNEGLKKKIKHLNNGFNRISKQYYIQNIQDQRLQFYSLKDQNTPIYHIKYVEKGITSISYISNKVYIINQCQLKIYNQGIMTQILNLSSKLLQQNINRCISFVYPIFCYSVGEKLILKIINAELQQQIEIPEILNNINIDYNSLKHEGLIICSGKISHSLYVFSFQLHNIEDSQIPNIEIMPINNQQTIQNDDLQISFSNKTTVSRYPYSKSFNKEIEKLAEPPKELRKLYQKQQEFYQQIKQFLMPKSNQKNQEGQIQMEQQADILTNQNQPNQLGIMLNYGYEIKQQVKIDSSIGNFSWFSDNNSLLLITGCGRSIMQHFFSIPVKHKIVSFPAQITSLSVSQKSHEELRYLSVCIDGLIKIYNVHQEISYIRSIDIIMKNFNGCIIFQSFITNCNRYLITLSFNNIAFDSKVYIHLIEISTGSVLSSSYISLPTPKNKYKLYQIKDAKDYRLIINPYKNSLQFVIYNSEGLLYFYRVTSIFTLQMMQLQQLVSLCRDKINSISSACFLCVGEESFQDSVLALGSQNGSLVFVDCRTGSIMIACVGVLASPIIGITYSKFHGQQYEKLILFSNSTFLTIFNLYNGLNSILLQMQQSPSTVKQQSIRKIMTLDGEVTSKSNIGSNSQQIVITKTGSLWLLDYEDLVTVKISSIHTAQINQAQIIGNDTSSISTSYLFTCSDDGSAKISSLSNLEQVCEVFKPRKMAKCFCTSGSLTLIAFNQQIYIYSKLDQQVIATSSSEFTCFGSFKLDKTIVNIQNIPSTNNYYILTQSQVFIVFVTLKTGIKKGDKLVSTIKNDSKINQIKDTKAIAEINKITDIQNPLTLVVNAVHAPYDQFALISRPGKATIWTRKCLKRNYSPIDELQNVHELSYYLIDAHSSSIVDLSYVKFISQTSYLWGLYQQGIIQIRDFREHAIMRQINLSLMKISAMKCIGDQQFTFYIGDQSGYIYIVNENGLLIQKIKALECKVKGIQLWQTKNTSKIMVFGSKYTAILNNVQIK